jgi:hypothetical protein
MIEGAIELFTLRPMSRCFSSTGTRVDQGWDPGCAAKVLSPPKVCSLTSATRTEGYYERPGASRSLGFRLTREKLGLDGTDPR